LKDCTCYDFKERKLPCKHIYRLAVELSIIEIVNKNQTAGKYKADHLSEILAMDDPNAHEEQRVRQRNARKCQIVSIDKEAQTAVFKGSGKKPYTTTTESCTCQDFGMRKLPCKHIYRLMHEVGRFNLDDVPDGRVSEIKGQIRDFDQSIIDGLSNEMLKELYFHLCGWMCEDFLQVRYEWFCERCNVVAQTLIKAGFLEEVEESILEDKLYKNSSFNEIRAFLKEKGIKVKNKNEATEKIIGYTSEFLRNGKERYCLLRFKETFKSIRATLGLFLRKNIVYPNNPEKQSGNLFWNDYYELFQERN
jgi:hypothetical protein